MTDLFTNWGINLETFEGVAKVGAYAFALFILYRVGKIIYSVGKGTLEAAKKVGATKVASHFSVPATLAGTGFCADQTFNSQGLVWTWAGLGVALLALSLEGLRARGWFRRKPKPWEL